MRNIVRRPLVRQRIDFELTRGPSSSHNNHAFQRKSGGDFKRDLSSETAIFLNLS